MERSVRKGDVLLDRYDGGFVLVVDIQVADKTGDQERFRYNLFCLTSKTTVERHFYWIEDYFSVFVSL